MINNFNKGDSAPESFIEITPNVTQQHPTASNIFTNITQQRSTWVTKPAQHLYTTFLALVGQKCWAGLARPLDLIDHIVMFINDNNSECEVVFFCRRQDHKRIELATNININII